jgi:hypothetical protein
VCGDVYAIARLSKSTRRAQVWGTIEAGREDVSQAAKQLSGRLFGVAPDMDEAYTSGFNIDGEDVGLDPTATARA